LAAIPGHGSLSPENILPGSTRPAIKSSSCRSEAQFLWPRVRAAKPLSWPNSRPPAAQCPGHPRPNIQAAKRPPCPSVQATEGRAKIPAFDPIVEHGSPLFFDTSRIINKDVKDFKDKFQNPLILFILYIPVNPLQPQTPNLSSPPLLNHKPQTSNLKPFKLPSYYSQNGRTKMEKK